MKRNTLQDLLEQIRPRYARSTKKEKKHILDEFVATTGYHRKYAVRLLRHGLPEKRRQRRRKSLYPATLDSILVQLAEALGWPAARYLHDFLPTFLTVMEEHQELRVTKEQRRLLLQMSAATIDRRLQPFRQQALPRARRVPTKPGSRLLHLVEVRTWAEPRPTEPGFLEIDLVAHGGGWSDGEFFWTLDVVDFATGWTELAPVPNRGERTTQLALEACRQRLPFALRGIDSDNDQAFINHHLVSYCKRRDILFTRSRPNRKNDQAYIEQRNWTVVRQYVGYGRYDTPEAFTCLGQLYAVLRLWVNFFKPVIRLQRKEVVDGKVRRRYDRAQTPYQRVLASPEVSQAVKDGLTQLFWSLNPVTLCEQLSALQDELWAHATVR